MTFDLFARGFGCRVVNAGKVAFAVGACGQFVIKELSPIGQDGCQCAIGRGIYSIDIGNHEVAQLVEIGVRYGGQVLAGVATGRQQKAEIGGFVHGDVTVGGAQRLKKLGFFGGCAFRLRPTV